MDDTIDFELTMPLPTKEKQERLKEHCKKIAELLKPARRRCSKARTA